MAALDAAERHDPDRALFLIVAAMTGARRGELCALRWTDIDLDAATVTFARVISIGSDGAAERRSPRPVRHGAPIPRPRAPRLRGHRRHCRMCRLSTRYLATPASSAFFSPTVTAS